MTEQKWHPTVFSKLDNTAYIERNITWDELCEKYPNKWVFLNNIVESDTGWNVHSADLLDYCAPEDLHKHVFKHIKAKDYQKCAFTEQFTPTFISVMEPIGSINTLN